MFKYIFTILLILNSSFALAGRHKISQPGKPDVYVPTLESDGKTLKTLNLVSPISPSARLGLDSVVTLTALDLRFQVVTLTAARTYTLPTTDIKTGDTFTFVNRATNYAYRLNINSSGGNAIDWMVNGKITVMALQDNPTSAAHWATVDAISDWTSYAIALTDSVGGATIANQTTSGKYKRSGDSISLHVRTSFSGAAPSSGTFRWSLPSGLTTDASKIFTTAISGGFQIYCVTYNASNSITSSGSMALLGGSNNFLALFTQNPINTDYVKGSFPGTWSSGDFVEFTGSSPIAEWAMFN